MKTIAIGDVHGCYELLLDTVTSYMHSDAELVFLGDLFDRAPTFDGDIKTLEFICDLQREPTHYGFSNVIVLRGNHEQLLLDAYETGDTEAWLYNGGDLNFLEYLRDNPQHVEWLRNLPYYLIRGNYLLVHAGVRPGVPLWDQDEDDFLWYRSNPNQGHVPHGLPYTVIHGHTIQIPPVITHYSDSIAIDTGAFATGILSSILIEYNETDLPSAQHGASRSTDATITNSD